MTINDQSEKSLLRCSEKTVPSFGSTELETVNEHRMDVFVNEVHAMRLVCTPSYLAELTVGRLFTEGIINDPSAIRNIYICEFGLRAKAYLKEGIKAEFKKCTAETVSTCCTDNRILISGADADTEPIRPVHWKVSWLRDASERMKKEEPLYKKTHAIHCCYLLKDGEILCCREDIGRHNALDKAIGYALIHQIPLEECILFTTGRMPLDMISKALRARVPVFVSKTYPTSEGAAAAAEKGLTLVTLTKKGNAVVWSGVPADDMA